MKKSLISENILEDILVEIKDILLEYVENTRPLTPADRLIDDLGLDSFLIVYFITEIEDCFEIDIPETDFIELVTVRISANEFSWK